jgi:hypothetical protein
VLLALATLACLKSSPPDAVSSPAAQVTVSGQCPWVWQDSVLSDGEWAGAEAVQVINVNGDAAPDLLADLGACGNYGDCLYAVLESCGNGSFQARWGPEYAQYVEVLGSAPLVLQFGGRSAQPGCDVPSERTMSWVDGQWKDQGTCYGVGSWDAESCGEAPEPRCGETEGSVLACTYKLLGAHWGLEESQVRHRMRERYEAGQASSIFTALESLSREAGIPWAIEPQVVLYEDGYSACDAAQVKATLGVAAPEERMRDMLLAGERLDLDALLKIAYAGDPVPCAFHQTEFSAADYKQLGASWGLTPDLAALRVAELVSTGQKAQVLRVLP